MRNKIFQLKNKKAKIVNFLKIKDEMYQLKNRMTKIVYLEKQEAKIVFQFKIKIKFCLEKKRPLGPIAMF